MNNSEVLEKLRAYLKCQGRQVKGIYYACNNKKCDDCDLCYMQGTTGEHIEAIEVATQALEKLQVYKNLEEQGRLVKLPCKVGDTVWQIMVVGIQGKNIQYGIFKAVVTKISVDYQMNFLLSTITEDGERYRNEVTSTAIGETMFFTKSEAEAKLKELRGGENER